MDENLGMYITLGVLVLSAAFFVWGKIRSDIVALCALLALMLTNVLTVEEALSGFSNNIVIMMAGLFIVGGGIFQTGLAKMISTRILTLAGTSEKKLFILVMLVTALIGSFVSNTGTVALMLPIVISLAAAANTDSKRLLMPLAFASSMGGDDDSHRNSAQFNNLRCIGRCRLWKLDLFLIPSCRYYYSYHRYNCAMAHE